MELPTQIFLYGLSLAIVALSVTVAYLINLYRKLITSLYDAKVQEKEKISELVYKKTEKVIDALTPDIKRRANDAVMEVVNASKAKLSADIEALIDKDGIGKALRESTLGVEEAVRRLVEEEYQKTKKELEDYKTAKYDEVSKKASQALSQILKNALVEIPQDIQEKMVLKAVSDAKRQNLL